MKMKQKKEKKKEKEKKERFNRLSATAKYEYFKKEPLVLDRYREIVITISNDRLNRNVTDEDFRFSYKKIHRIG